MRDVQSTPPAAQGWLLLVERTRTSPWTWVLWRRAGEIQRPRWVGRPASVSRRGRAAPRPLRARPRARREGRARRCGKGTLAALGPPIVKSAAHDAPNQPQAWPLRRAIVLAVSTLRSFHNNCPPSTTPPPSHHSPPRRLGARQRVPRPLSPRSPF